MLALTATACKEKEPVLPEGQNELVGHTYVYTKEISYGSDDAATSTSTLTFTSNNTATLVSTFSSSHESYSYPADSVVYVFDGTTGSTKIYAYDALEDQKPAHGVFFYDADAHTIAWNRDCGLFTYTYHLQK